MGSVCTPPIPLLLIRPIISPASFPSSKVLHLSLLGAALPPPPAVTPALKLGRHPFHMTRQLSSQDSVVPASVRFALRHHLPRGGVQVEVGSRGRIPPLAPPVRGAHGPTAESRCCGYVNQVRAQKVIDVGFDSLTGGLEVGKQQKPAVRERMYPSSSSINCWKNKLLCFYLLMLAAFGFLLNK